MEMRGFGGVTSEVWQLAPAVSRGRAPGPEVWKAHPQKLKVFSLHKYLTFAPYEVFMRNYLQMRRT